MWLRNKYRQEYDTFIHLIGSEPFDVLFIARLCDGRCRLSPLFKEFSVSDKGTVFSTIDSDIGSNSSNRVKMSVDQIRKDISSSQYSSLVDECRKRVTKTLTKTSMMGELNEIYKNIREKLPESMKEVLNSEMQEVLSLRLSFNCGILRKIAFYWKDQQGPINTAQEIIKGRQVFNTKTVDKCLSIKELICYFIQIINSDTFIFNIYNPSNKAFDEVQPNVAHIRSNSKLINVLANEVDELNPSNSMISS
jgi:hypothetical protein